MKNICVTKLDQDDDQTGIEVVDLDDFVQPTEGYLHESSIKNKHTGRSLPKLIEDDEILFVIEGNSRLVQRYNSGRKTARVIILDPNFYSDELREAKRDAAIARSYGVLTLEHLSKRVVDAKTYAQLEGLPVSQRISALEEYLSQQ
jgi:hypothetical protein